MSNIIPIDGTTASGKSTVGLLFAEKIGYQFIDSGLIFRAGTWLILKNHIEITDHLACARVFEQMQMEFKTANHQEVVLVNGEDVTDQLHTPKIDESTPIIAAYSEVRAEVKKIKHQVSGRQNTVMAGRDIGSEIFPEAKLKFFITASLQARAARRFKQRSLNNPSLTYQEVESEIAARDLKDSTRDASPMRIPTDAITIDTSDQSIEQVVNELLKHFQTSQLAGRKLD